ncbi:MAG TPA: ArsR family transcriptional regulator [Conexivisphaerales archaeon]|nr:ArsR family transcriptional regulator [Conexivisphaerales archaeon]
MTNSEAGVYHALDCETRVGVLNCLYDGPKAIEDVASRVGIHPFTARYHLRALEVSGLATKKTVKQPRGRPKFMYQLSGSPLHLSFPRRRYEDLTRELFLISQKVEGRQELRKLLWRIGHERSERLASVPGEQANGRTFQDFKRLLLEGDGHGLTTGSGVVEDTERRLVYRVYDCPYRELAFDFPDLLCGAMEEGFRDGLIELSKGRFTVERHGCMASGSPYCEYEAGFL